MTTDTARAENQLKPDVTVEDIKVERNKLCEKKSFLIYLLSRRFDA
jgi:hypothetical protein